MRHLSVVVTAAALLMGGTSAMAMDAAQPDTSLQLAQSSGSGGDANGGQNAGNAGGPQAMPNQQAHDLLESHTGATLSGDEIHAYGDDAFTGYDSDGDGYLSDEEWGTRNSAYWEMQTDTAADFDADAYNNDSLSAYDTDADGRVSKEEWDAQVDTYYGTLDTNGDGQVDQSELDAARKM